MALPVITSLTSGQQSNAGSSISSSQAGSVTVGAGKLIGMIFATARTDNVSNPTGVRVTGVSMSGVSFSEVFDESEEFNVGGSFPYSAWHVQMFVGKSGAGMTSRSWTSSMSGGFTNQQMCLVVSIEDVANMNNPFDGGLAAIAATIFASTDTNSASNTASINVDTVDSDCTILSVFLDSQLDSDGTTPVSTSAGSGQTAIDNEASTRQYATGNLFAQYNEEASPVTAQAQAVGFASKFHINVAVAFTGDAARAPTSVFIESLSRGTRQFSDFGGTGSISSSHVSPIVTSHDDQVALFVFYTGRSQDVSHPGTGGVDALTISGHTPELVYTTRLEWNVPGNDGSYPYGELGIDIFLVPIPTQQSGLAWSTTSEDGYINNQTCWLYILDGIPDIDAIKRTSFNYVDNFSASSTSPEADLTTDGGAIVLGMFATRNSGFTFTNAPSGYLIDQTSMGGHSSSDYKVVNYYGEEASAISGKSIGDQAGTTSYWFGVVFGIGADDDSGPTVTARVTSVAAEVAHTGGAPKGRVSSVAAEVALVGATKARVSSVAAEVALSLAPTPPLDGSKFLSANFQTKESLHYQNADYDSIYSRGDRAGNLIMTFGHYGVNISPGATMGSSHNSNYAHPTGSGLAFGENPIPAGAGAWIDFAGEDVEIAAFRMIGTENYEWDTDELWAFYGGIGVGLHSDTPYGREFDAFAPSQATYDAATGLYSTEFPATARDGQIWSHYEYAILATTNQSQNRFANEIEYKIAHSGLDGGDRRSSAPANKRVAFSMSSEWVFDATGGKIDPANALFDGVPVRLNFPSPGGGNSKNGGNYSIIKDSVETDGVQTTPGQWFQFVFPREVSWKHICLVVDTQVEEYDSGDLPMHYGTWHWEFSKNGGSTWTSIGVPWSFRPDTKFMVAPRDGKFLLSHPSLGKGATQWRMVLDSGPAFKNNYILAQFIFNLDDQDGQAATLAIAFSDDADPSLPEPTVTYLSSFVAAFSDGDDGFVTYTLSNTPTFNSSVAFTDDGELEFYSDLLPSIYPQVVIVATGRG